MKKILFVFTLIFTLFNISFVEADEHDFYINNNNIKISEEEYKNLVNLGFSENEILYMNKETYESNKDLVGEVVYKNTKYFKSIKNGNDIRTYEVDENEYFAQSNIVLCGTISTYYKAVTTTITKLSSTFRYKVSTSWLNFPDVKNYDVIAIGMNSQVYISSDIYFELYYCDNSSCYQSTACSPKKTSTGGGASFKLPNVQYTSLSSTLYFEVSKNTSSTITSLSLCGAYAHSTTNQITLTDAKNYTLGSAGISFNVGSGSKFDIVQCAPANWSGNW